MIRKNTSEVQHRLRVRPLAWALSRMTPGLWAPEETSEETPEDADARTAAAFDILSDLLDEYAETRVEAVEGVAA